jgi:ribosomal protein L37AE/L43A
MSTTPPAPVWEPATSAERAVPYFCPYCADEDLRPLGATPGQWHCRACLRTFGLRFLGVAPTPTPEPAPSRTGGSR